MILFFEHGRTGNQLFQYVGLKKYFPDERIIFLGCEDLRQYFDNIEAQFIPKRAVSRWVLPFELLKRIAFFLANARILGRVTEDSSATRYKLFVRNGIFWRIFVPQNVFCQHRDVLENIESPPVLKPYLLEKAIDWLCAKGINPEFDSLVFVHIRRGDYLYWPSKEFPAVLDLGWYKRAINSILEKNSTAVFILMSDDQYYLRDIFEESEKLAISDNAPEIDLAIMSLCCSGVLSASSFAWWGAFFAHTEKKENTHFIAPKYWGGHRSKKWHPPNFHTEWITYIE